MTGSETERSGRAGGPGEPSRDQLPLALSELETAVLAACAAQREWPAQIAAGVYAGVDYAIANPAVAHALTFEAAVESDSVRRYERVIGRFAGFIQIKAPLDSRLPGSTDEALVAGIVGLVGDHLRIGRVDRLERAAPGAGPAHTAALPGLRRGAALGQPDGLLARGGV